VLTNTRWRSALTILWAVSDSEPCRGGPFRCTEPAVRSGDEDLAGMLHFLPLVRKDRQLSLEQLARAIHADRFLLARLERGETPRDPAIVDDLARALDVDAAVFVASAVTVHLNGRIEVAK
jgi:hypothetical protein